MRIALNFFNLPQRLGSLNYNAAPPRTTPSFAHESIDRLLARPALGMEARIDDQAPGAPESLSICPSRPSSRPRTKRLLTARFGFRRTQPHESAHGYCPCEDGGTIPFTRKYVTRLP